MTADVEIYDAIANSEVTIENLEYEVYIGDVVSITMTGSSFYYVHTQVSAATVWVVNHSLNAYPNVTAVNSAGDKIYGELVYNSPNQVTLTFSEALTGKAYLT